MEEYVALRSKVDAFCAEAEAHAKDALSCRKGCDSCCRVWLSVSAVEARAIGEHIAQLSAEKRESLARRGALESQREEAGEEGARCPMLSDEGDCDIYAARPMICRTQGLALRYPSGTVPETAVRWKTTDGEGELVACPLNYAERAPTAEETLDADMLNTLLGLVNQRQALSTGGDPGLRTPLSALAQGKGVLATD